MLANRRRDTDPELQVRSLLHAAGLRYRVDFAPGANRRRRADIVFTRARIAVFIDGCFWHGCFDHFIAPRSNSEYWAQKIDANRRRDRETTAQLEAEGWMVLRYWEHASPDAAAEEIIRAWSARQK